MPNRKRTKTGLQLAASRIPKDVRTDLRIFETIMREAAALDIRGDIKRRDAYLRAAIRELEAINKKVQAVENEIRGFYGAWNKKTKELP